MPFHIVLHQPQIPNNTGNIGRTCIATGCTLHLIRPLGFDTSEKACRRAGLDYWPRLAPLEHESWSDYQQWRPAPAAATSTTLDEPRRWFFTTRATRPVWDAPLARGDHFIFGRETEGLPADLLEAHPESLLTLPMLPTERSLNLATAVCAVVYEGLRQLVAAGDLALDQRGRLHA